MGWKMKYSVFSRYDLWHSSHNYMWGCKTWWKDAINTKPKFRLVSIAKSSLSTWILGKYFIQTFSFHLQKLRPNGSSKENLYFLKQFFHKVIPSCLF